MISTELARQLRDSGLTWTPASGDSFRIDRDGFEDDVFTLSDMTIESHQFDTGTILGFNGTTEWALDSVALEFALWLPREDQLRELLGEGFQSLVRLEGVYRVEVARGLELVHFTAERPADAYALAVYAMVAPTH